MNKDGRVSIKIQASTKKKLQQLGGFNDSYDTIIIRLIEKKMQKPKEGAA